MVFPRKFFVLEDNLIWTEISVRRM